MKKYLIILAWPAFFLLAGAGCAIPQPPANNETAKPPAAASTALTEPKLEADEFNLKVETLNPGIVKFSWDAPPNMDPKTETFLLLHSAKPEPVYPGAFWYRRIGTDREGVWGNIPSGQRYFRICASTDGQCVKYSKIVNLEIK